MSLADPRERGGGEGIFSLRSLPREGKQAKETVRYRRRERIEQEALA